MLIYKLIFCNTLEFYCFSVVKKMVSFLQITIQGFLLMAIRIIVMTVEGRCYSLMQSLCFCYKTKQYKMLMQKTPKKTTVFCWIKVQSYLKSRCSNWSFRLLVQCLTLFFVTSQSTNTKPPWSCLKLIYSTSCSTLLSYITFWPLLIKHVKDNKKKTNNWVLIELLMLESKQRNHLIQIN